MKMRFLAPMFAAMVACAVALALASGVGCFALVGADRAFADEGSPGGGVFNMASGRVSIPETTVVGDACELVSVRSQEVVNPSAAAASVFHNGAMAYYGNIAEAVEAAVSGDTVTLLRSAYADVVVDKAITLNLGGKTLIGTGSASAAGVLPDAAVTLSVTAENAIVCNGAVRSRSSSVECVGVVVSGSSAMLSELAIESAGVGLLARDSSQVNLDNVAVSGSSATGAVVAEGSHLVLSLGAVANKAADGGYGVYAVGESTVAIGDAEDVGSRSAEISAHVPDEGYSAVYAGNGSSVMIYGGLFCTDVDVASGSFSFASPFTQLTQIDEGDAEDGGKWCLAVDYTVTFYDEDGTTELASTSYPLNTAAADVVQPTPTKADSDGYKYFFDGWSHSVAVVTRDASYVARYVAKRDLAYADVTFADVVYTGEALEPAAAVSFDYGQTVVPATSYGVEYSNNVNAGVDAGVAVITASDASADYAGSVTAHFTIGKRPTVASADPTALTLSYGTPGTVTVTGDHVGSIARAVGDDSVAAVSFDGNTVTVDPVGIGSFALVVSAESSDANHADPDDVVVDVTVSPIALTDDMVGVPASQAYTGQQIRPPVTVTYGGQVIQPEGNYSVAYGENVSVSEGGTVTVTGLGTSFTGSVTKAFAITAGSDEWSAAPYATTGGQKVDAAAVAGAAVPTLALVYDGVSHGLGIETAVPGAEVAIEPADASILNPGTLTVSYTLVDPSGALAPEAGSAALVIEPRAEVAGETSAGTVRVVGGTAFSGLSHDGAVVDVVAKLLGDDGDAGEVARVQELRARYLANAGDPILFWVFDVRLMRHAATDPVESGTELRDGFGTLTVRLPVGVSYFGRTAHVIELHEALGAGGSATEEEIDLGTSLKVDELGWVDVEVDRLSEFVVVLDSASDGSAGNGSGVTVRPAPGASSTAKTGDSLVVWPIAAVAAVAAVVLVAVLVRLRRSRR